MSTADVCSNEGAAICGLFDGKVCKRCGQWKEFVAYKPSKTHKDGRGSWCRDCNRVYLAERARAVRDGTHLGRTSPMRGEESKVCGRCSQVKPLESFSKGTSGAGGRKSYCKKCEGEVAKAERAKHAAHLGKTKPETRRCGDCGETKPSSDFTLDRGRKDGLKPYCRACCKRRHRVINSTDEARERGRLRQAESRRVNPEAARATLRRRREREHVRYLEAISKALLRLERPNYTTKCAIKGVWRRTRARDLEGAITMTEWVEMKARADHRCLCCGRQEPDVKLTFDHIVPVSSGGDSSSGNIQPLCKSCNCAKHTNSSDYRPADWPWRSM